MPSLPHCQSDSFYCDESRFRESCLHIATAHHDVPLVRLLLERKASPASESPEGTALELAMRLNFSDIVALLQATTDEPLVTDNKPNTPLQRSRSRARSLLKGCGDSTPSLGTGSSSTSDLLAIARALVLQPSLLILDESTSNLDSESERAIQHAIESLQHQVTQVIVAHRLSTILHADQIVVMDQGSVVGVGTHAELLVTCPEYRSLYVLQHGGDIKLSATTKECSNAVCA